MSNENSSSGGIGFTGLLTIVFITLKLCSVINWSWWWVLSPMLFGVAIGLALLVIAGVLALREKRKIKRLFKKEQKEPKMWGQRLREFREQQKISK